MSGRGAVFAFAVIVLILGSFFLYPLYKTVRGGFFDDDGHFTLEFLKEVFRNPIYLEGLWNSFRLAVATTLVVLCLSVPLAFLSSRFLFPGKSWLAGIVLVPMILPPFVGAIGLRQFWGQMGVLNAILFRLGICSGRPIDWLGINQFWGVVIAQALHLYPVMYLNATAALSNIDPAMDEAARNLGAGRLRRLFGIMLPLMMPGLFAGGTIVFIWAFTELGTPLMFDFNRVSSVQVFSAIKEVGDNPFAYVLVVVIMFSSVCTFLFGKFIAGRHSQVVATKAARASQEKRLVGSRAWMATLLFAGVSLLALIPHTCVVLMSLSRDWYSSILPSQWTTEHYRA
ncbi:MAG TPA: ABC transporter permease subunit, partial [bacterium]|nr:ABC transporter permease subunit [bacterium]